MKLSTFLSILAIIPLALGSYSYASGSSSESHEGYGGGKHGNHPRPPRPPKVTTPPPTPAPYCEPGWTLSRRIGGGWCIRVFQGVTNQEEAENACRLQGAVLSSVENAEERMLINQLGTTLMTSTTNWKYGTLRLGLVRNSISANRYSAGPFVMTDGFTIGLEGLTWSPKEPSSGYTDGHTHSCGMMWLWVPGGMGSTRLPGTMFSMVCPKTWNDRFRGYVCGKRAT